VSLTKERVRDEMKEDITEQSTGRKRNHRVERRRLERRRDEPKDQVWHPAVSSVASQTHDEM
jgi:hypothetical protein